MVAESLNRELCAQWGAGVVSRILHGGQELRRVRWEETGVEAGAVVRVEWVESWTVESWTGVLEGHAGDVWAVASLGDGRVVSGSEDKTVRIWGANG